jgi:hypothetical protein
MLFLAITMLALLFAGVVVLAVVAICIRRSDRRMSLKDAPAGPIDRAVRRLLGAADRRLVDDSRAPASRR